jgi:uncharacterized protein YjbJ (UPF0337 family)
MNKLIAEGTWNVVKGKLKQKYGHLTDEDLTYTEGQEDELVGRLQQRLGLAREEMERELDEALRDPKHDPRIPR